ncbi:MAG TPA: aspartate aminotransferase family protein [Candidatus Limiplasma pullistercoris]|nr:aspartate aminotransferase family protein [Candidatus Limiplasma pullistercoris]
MRMTDIQALDSRYVAHTYARAPVTFVRGEGCRLYDEAGKAYIDMGSGIAVNALGFGDEGWVAAVSAQAGQLAHASNLYHTAPQALLAQRLCERTGMKRVFFGNSGAEANECAIKAARRYSALKHGENVRPVILTLENSFHGRTLATLAATGQDAFHHDFGPFPEGFRHVPANDADALKAALDVGDVCALLIETIQGEGGVNCLTEEYIRAAREMTEARDILLMIDEVQTGNGRTGKLYSYQHFGIQPDVVSTAKGLAGGLPMGACLLSEKAADVLTPGTHGSTFGGNPVCAAAALYVQDRLTDELMAEVAQKGEWVRAELAQLPGVTVSGRGLMLGVESGKPASALVSDLLARGVVTLTAKTRLRLLPPLTIPWPDLKQAVSIIKEALSA